MEPIRFVPGRAILLLAVLFPLLLACGDDGTTGPTTGEAEMLVTDDAGAAQASALSDAVTRAFFAEIDRRAAAGETLPVRFAGSGSAVATDPAATAAAQLFEGTITADAQASISADGQTWIDLGSPTEIAVELQSSGDSTDVHGTAEVDTGTYSRFRLVMEDARATLNAGSTIGGLTLTADVVLTLGTGGSVTVEHEVTPVQVSADLRTTLVLDMNSEGWANEENAEDEQVEEQEVQDSSEGSSRQTPQDPQ